MSSNNTSGAGDVIVRIHPQYYRPAEVETLLGDPTLARERMLDHLAAVRGASEPVHGPAVRISRAPSYAPLVVRIEHWLAAEELWDDEPKDETWEEEVLERGAVARLEGF